MTSECSLLKKLKYFTQLRSVTYTQPHLRARTHALMHDARMHARHIQNAPTHPPTHTHTHTHTHKRACTHTHSHRQTDRHTPHKVPGAEQSVGNASPVIQVTLCPAHRWLSSLRQALITGRGPRSRTTCQRRSSPRCQPEKARNVKFMEGQTMRPE